MNKLSLALCKHYMNAKLKMSKLFKEEDGMETIETVILIIVALVVAVAIIGAIGSKDGGLIKSLFDTITSHLEDLFK